MPLSPIIIALRRQGENYMCKVSSRYIARCLRKQEKSVMGRGMREGGEGKGGEVNITK